MSKEENYKDMVRVSILENPFIKDIRIFDVETTINKETEITSVDTIKTDTLKSTKTITIRHEGDFVRYGARDVLQNLGDASKNTYRLFLIICAIVEDYYNFNGAIEINLDIINDPRVLIGDKFTIKSMYASLKELCTNSYLNKKIEKDTKKLREEIEKLESQSKARNILAKIKKLKQELSDKVEELTETYKTTCILIKHTSRPHIYWVNPLCVYRGQLMSLVKRYNFEETSRVSPKV